MTRMAESPSSTTARPATCTASRTRSPGEQEARWLRCALRHVEELTSKLVISQNQCWGRHRSEAEDEPSRALRSWSERTASPSALRRGSATWRHS
jgi:hypothetical protein